MMDEDELAAKERNARIHVLKWTPVLNHAINKLLYQRSMPYRAQAAQFFPWALSVDIEKRSKLIPRRNPNL
jgi:hypothetical protein